MALPKFEVYTTDKTSPRSFPWLWFVRLPAIAFSIVVLGITAANHSTFSNSGCNPPSKLSYNIAVAVISFIFLIYLILSTGPSPKVRLLPWLIWGQLALDALLFVLWLAAAASSRYNCNDLCKACDGYSDLYYDNLLCYCFNSFYKRDLDYSPVRKGPLVTREPRRSVNHSSSSDASTGYASTADARKAFDAIMVILFFICLVADLLWIFKASKSSTTTTTTAPAAGGPTPIKFEEAGMSTPAAGVPMNTQNPGANSEYHNNQPMQQQPPMTQGQYPEGQYPPQYTQGQPEQQQYPPPQAMPQQQQHFEGPQQGSHVEPNKGAAEMYSPSHISAPP